MPAEFQFLELQRTSKDSSHFAVKAQRVANALPARMVAAMAGTSRAMRLALWLCPEAVQVAMRIVSRLPQPMGITAKKQRW